MNNKIQKIKLDRAKPLGNQIYEQLRKKIIVTELYPLSEIYESDLAKNLNVSRTPIRDALKKLENDGLIKTIPQVKSIIAKIDTSQIQQANEIRATLETSVVNKLSKIITKSQILNLSRINSNISKNVKLRKFNNVYYFDNMFHQTLANQAKMPMTWQIINQISTQIDRIRNISYKHQGDITYGPIQAIKDHQEIINFLSKKNTKNVKIAMQKHIISLQRYVLFIKKTKEYKNVID